MRAIVREGDWRLQWCVLMKQIQEERSGGSSVFQRRTLGACEEAANGGGARKAAIANRHYTMNLLTGISADGLSGKICRIRVNNDVLQWKTTL